MTTIAFDGKTLAVDSMVTVGDVTVDTRATKLFKNVGRFQVVALSGDIVEMQALIDWIKQGEEDEPPLSQGVLICIDQKGHCYTMNGEHNGRLYKERPPCAEGSGWQFAIAAMDAGCDAIKAVKVACKRDVHSGGRVKSYKVK